MSSAAMLQALTATPELRDVAAEKLSGITPLLFDGAQLKRLTDEGFLEALVIYEGGTAIMVCWVHSTADRGFHINAAVSLVPGADKFDCLDSAMTAVAKKRNAGFIRFNTKRPGLVAKAETAGFRAESLVMIKKL